MNRMSRNKPLCHECRHFKYDDVRKWPDARCLKDGTVVNGLKIRTQRPRPVSRMRPCASFDPHGLMADGFPDSLEEYSMEHFEWDGD